MLRAPKRLEIYLNKELYTFQAEHDGYGKPFLPTSVTGRWIKLRKKYGIDDIRLHDLRHTMITYLLNEETPIFAVSKRAGHSSIKITSDTYGQFGRSHRKNSYETIRKAPI